jgi:hypothetical protein
MYRLLLCLALGSSACGGAAATLVPGAERVVVHKGDAPADAVEVGPVEATDGNGCGAFGTRGTYAGAYIQMRNAAYQLGANFVRIDSIEQPHMDPNPRASCFHNEFTLLGVAFKLPGSAAVQIAPSPAPVRPRAEPAIAAPAPAPRSENNSCHNTESCYRLGQCSSVNGACVVLVDDDCKGSMECTKGHRCSASAGHCVAKPRSAGVAEP